MSNLSGWYKLGAIQFEPIVQTIHDIQHERFPLMVVNYNDSGIEITGSEYKFGFYRYNRTKIAGRSIYLYCYDAYLRYFLLEKVAKRLNYKVWYETVGYAEPSASTNLSNIISYHEYIDHMLSHLPKSQRILISKMILLSKTKPKGWP